MGNGRSKKYYCFIFMLNIVYLKGISYTLSANGSLKYDNTISRQDAQEGIHRSPESQYAQLVSEGMLKTVNMSYFQQGSSHDIDLWH